MKNSGKIGLMNVLINLLRSVSDEDLPYKGIMRGAQKVEELSLKKMSEMGRGMNKEEKGNDGMERKEEEKERENEEWQKLWEVSRQLESLVHLRMEGSELPTYVELLQSQKEIERMKTEAEEMKREMEESKLAAVEAEKQLNAHIAELENKLYPPPITSLSSLPLWFVNKSVIQLDGNKVKHTGDSGYYPIVFTNVLSNVCITFLVILSFHFDRRRTLYRTSFINCFYSLFFLVL